MKKSLAFACIVCAFTVSSFAQSAPDMTPAELGAQLVAKRDAAWNQAHSGSVQVKEPMVPQTDMHAKLPKHGKHAKHSKHARHSKHAKHSMHHVKKGGMTDGNQAMPQK